VQGDPCTFIRARIAVTTKALWRVLRWLWSYIPGRRYFPCPNSDHINWKYALSANGLYYASWEDYCTIQLLLMLFSKPNSIARPELWNHSWFGTCELRQPDASPFPLPPYLKELLIKHSIRKVLQLTAVCRCEHDDRNTNLRPSFTEYLRLRGEPGFQTKLNDAIIAHTRNGRFIRADGKKRSNVNNNIPTKGALACEIVDIKALSLSLYFLQDSWR